MAVLGGAASESGRSGSAETQDIVEPHDVVRRISSFSFLIHRHLAPGQGRADGSASAASRRPVDTKPSQTLALNAERLEGGSIWSPGDLQIVLVLEYP